ncbi:DNA polymerase III subunit delta' C-terminal domain-containing protein [Salmonella enterica]|uniref:DNA polymerase III subunit delta' C-terminal domain-containing protein n=1 Tax=Salmonella enterica TaxID=28901 RepID=UPI00398C7498
MDGWRTGAGDAVLAWLGPAQAAARLDWLATPHVDAQLYQHRAPYLANVEAEQIDATLAVPLSPARLQSIPKGVCHPCHQLLHVFGINGELVLTDLIARIQH